jgi:hypothetical protein
MTPEESTQRLEAMLMAHAGEDPTLLNRCIPMLVIASGAKYHQLGPKLQITWRTFLAEIGAAEDDTSSAISRKVDAYYQRYPLPNAILTALASTIAVANRSVAMESAAARSDDNTIRSAPNVDEVSLKQRKLPMRIPKVFR